MCSSDLVRSTDQSIGFMRNLPDITGAMDEYAYAGHMYHQGLIRNNHAHLYPNASAAFPKGTASVLVYGKAPVVGQSTEVETKKYNGSLVEQGMDRRETRLASDISFSPDPIYTGAFPDEAVALADALTQVAQAVTYTQTYYYYQNNTWRSGQTAVSWDGNIAELTLRSYYQWFTGGGELITGAGTSVEYLLSNLFGRLTRFQSDDEEPVLHLSMGVEYPTVLTEGGDDTCTYADLYNGLCSEILNRFQELIDDGILTRSGSTVSFTDPAYRRYPISFGLPSGAAVLRWNGLRFVVVSEGLDGIAAMDHYCYMPPLYYFVNSTLSTSTSDMYQRYTSDIATWDQILGTYRQGKAVSTTTESVALDYPLQFAVGQLSATIRATASLLPDNDGDARTNCSVVGTNFPVTGVIIGKQYAQSFDFTPDDSGDEFYLYDSVISGTYLTTTESSPFHTLVLPVPPGEDVYLFLELRNDSGATFTGAEGLILPGNYFYLAGKLEKSDDPALPQVFMSDHRTNAQFVVSSLANAHVAVPEMGDPTMVLGVQTTLNWIMSASSYVVLD